MKLKLFSTTITPSCQYCEFGKLTKDHQMVLCNKKGAVAPYYSCKKFDYAPLKRVPKLARALPEFSKEDFKL
ncbi:MAG: hypothetical protein RR497_01145 [Oscillospiraceae bacterium]